MNKIKIQVEIYRNYSNLMKYFIYISDHIDFVTTDSDAVIVKESFDSIRIEKLL